MLKMLGIFDLIVVALILSIAFSLDIPTEMFIFVALFLLVKGILSLIAPLQDGVNIGGAIDVGVFVVLIISVFITLPLVVLIITAVAIGQKGLLSLLC